MLRTGWSPLLPVLFVCACAPPPAIQVGDTDPQNPEIRIVVPPLSPAPVIPLSAACDLDFEMAVDLDNITFVPAGVEPDNIDGHGHFHVIGGAGSPLENYYFAAKSQLVEVHVRDADLTGGQTFADYLGSEQAFTIVANIAHNDHELVDCDTCRSTLEFTIAAGECVVE
jgi:hypothetical protein